MTDEELIARLRDAKRDWPEFGHDRAEAAARIEALTEQLAAARQDAHDAEDELELQEQEACMMENGYIKLEKERDALEAKLAKAVEALGAIVVDDTWGLDHDVYMMCRTTLAEIKGESHE
jgi:chromosome segregation ATPase